MESKSSSEETDRSEQGEGSRSGCVRSYECVFCKRGFTTAQALGGHMNIHRKDKAKTKTSPSVSAKIDAISRSNQPVQSYVPHYAYYHGQGAAVPSSAWGLRPQESHHGFSRWPRDLGLANGTCYVDDGENKKVEYKEDEELDLELRLGYHP